MKRKRNGYMLELKGRAPRRILRAAPKYRVQESRYISDKENKFVNYSKALTVIGVNWVTRNPATTDCISAVAQGDTDSSRDGRVYYINSAHIRGQVTQPIQEAQGAPVGDSVVRILMVLDTQTNKTEMTATDCMDNSGTGDWMGFRNLSNTSRFKVLKDMTIRLETSLNAQNEGAVNAFTTSGLVQPFVINYKFKTPLKVICPLTTAIVGAISDNSIHIVCCSSNASNTIEYQSRVRFYK